MASKPGQNLLGIDRSRLLSWWLYFAGVMEILAFFAVIMPRSWMESSHVWLGLGDMVAGPVTIFMIREASYTYGMHGIMLCILASDVIRYRPLIVFTGISYLLATVVFFLIDHTSGLPLWWTLGDSLAVGTFGIVVLFLCRRL
jgi:hypothetical protein